MSAVDLAAVEAFSERYARVCDEQDYEALAALCSPEQSRLSLNGEEHHGVDTFVAIYRQALEARRGQSTPDHQHRGRPHPGHPRPHLPAGHLVVRHVDPAGRGLLRGRACGRRRRAGLRGQEHLPGAGRRDARRARRPEPSYEDRCAQAGTAHPTGRTVACGPQACVSWPRTRNHRARRSLRRGAPNSTPRRPQEKSSLSQLVDRLRRAVGGQSGRDHGQHRHPEQDVHDRSAAALETDPTDEAGRHRRQQSREKDPGAALPLRRHTRTPARPAHAPETAKVNAMTRGVRMPAASASCRPPPIAYTWHPNLVSP